MVEVAKRRLNSPLWSGVFTKTLGFRLAKPLYNKRFHNLFIVDSGPSMPTRCRFISENLSLSALLCMLASPLAAQPVAQPEAQSVARSDALPETLPDAPHVVLSGDASADSSAPLEYGLDQPGILDQGGMFDASTPDVVVTVRAGGQVSPGYFGSDDYSFGPSGSVRLDFLRFPNGLEYGSSRSVGFQRGFGLSGSARYIGERSSSNYSELTGLTDIDRAFEVGLGVGYEQENYRVFGNVRYGVIGHHAWVGELGADVIATPTDNLTLTAGPRIDLGDRNFTNTYFGVSADEALSSGLLEFNAESGVVSAGMEFLAIYMFNPRWGLEGKATWDRLLNDAANSPITGLGSTDQFTVQIGITRRFSLEF